MKRALLLLAALWAVLLPAQARKARKTPADHHAVEIPSVEKRILAVETAHTALLLEVRENGTLVTSHYGARIARPEQFLGSADGRGLAYGAGPAAYPATGGTFVGEPALHVRYADGYHNTELYYTGHSVQDGGNVITTTIRMKDYVTALEVLLVYEAYQAEDVIASHAEVLNGGNAPVELLQCASSSLYIDADAYLLTHFYGDWAREMQVDRTLLTHDTKVIESRRGVQATQCNNPSFLLSLNTDRFSETEGEVLAGALAWSGNFRLSFEMDPSHRVNIVSGISPFASAWKLDKDETFITPDMLWTYSRQGAGGASRNLHAWARHYGVYGGGAVNPTLLNSWEGAYFNFTTPVLLGMIDDAAQMGLEMFVLDDGWFAMDYPRNGDDQGLGDWELNSRKIPEGIDYVASYAHQKGLKFGIWIEPEMVSPKSNLAAAHPDWVVRSPGREIYQARNQWVLDLSNPQVQDFVFGVFDRTMQLSSNIDYVKWDCNRIVWSEGSDYLGTEQERFYIAYCQGLYEVMRRIRAKYPEVLIQCCSSGGGRVDYGALNWFNECWTSDNTDGLTRAYIQYATSLVYPACIMGSHVSAVPNHQTGNITPLKFRFDMACAGRLGMELQPKHLSEADRALAARCIDSYKAYRDLVFGGDLYRLASPYDGPYYALMYVAPDRSRAVVFLYCLSFRNRATDTHTFRLQGLDPARTYKVQELNVDHSCFRGNGASFGGDFLMEGGFTPLLQQNYASAVFLLEAE